jgi:hypothetical protein
MSLKAINKFFGGECNRVLFGLIFFVSIALIATLEYYEAKLWGRIYNASFCLVLFVIIKIISKRPVFGIATTSLIFSSIWAASEIKFLYTNTRLIPVDLYAAILSKEVFVEMVAPESFLFITLVLCLCYLFRREVPYLETRNNYDSLALTLIPIIILGALHSSSMSPFQIYSRSNAVQIFIENLFVNFEDFKGNDKFCCMKANREAERFTRTPDDLPHIIVVLEESTFMPENIRGYNSKTEFFEQSHKLHVHTIGAGTWVQEISVLHGVPPPKYGNNYYSINFS